ncbi:MAG: LytTR family DNA-binding domain-containing protein [Sedimentitalea sp.]
MISQILRQTSGAAVQSMTGPAFWVVTMAVIFVCFLSGPFGTLQSMPGALRLVYWGLVVMSTATLGLWMHALIRTQAWHGIVRFACVSMVFGVLASALVVFLTMALLSPSESFPGIARILIYCFPSAALIFLTTVVLDELWANPTRDEAARPPALIQRLEKLPGAQRILALSAQDHYVEIITDVGSELCLLRLNDAIAETAPEEGLQIHRSHWVAKSAVKVAKTKGQSPQVELTNGRVLKVSQSRAKQLEAFLGG